MKGIFRKFLFINILLLSSHSYSQQQTLSVGWELWYPYQYYNDKQKLSGLDFEIFNAIIAQTRYAVNYTELPWKRHLHYIKTGEMDIAMGSSRTPEREDYAHFSLPYRKETVKLYVKNGQANKIQITKLEELISSPYMIGVEGGYYYGKQYQELINRNEFQSHINEVIDIEENVQLLLKGHIDGFLVDPVTMNAFVKKYKMQGEFEQHEMDIYSDNISIMISKKNMNKDLPSKIDAAILHLKQSGKLDKIIQSWTQLQVINK
jgi:polar amino acid transport system substrate-binding protein